MTKRKQRVEIEDEDEDLRIGEYDHDEICYEDELEKRQQIIDDLDEGQMGRLIADDRPI